MRKVDPPQSDELELSLFGPGIGECLVLHLGYGNWMVIDSCENYETGKAIAVDYLESQGIDIARQVQLVVVTHWHDDHIKGISQVLDLAAKARFCCSAALNQREFLTLVAAADDARLISHRPGTYEFAHVFEILQTRASSQFVAGPHCWACENQLLFAFNGVEVHALSPSAQTITDAKGAIADLIPKVGDEVRCFPSVSPNDFSVVLVIKAGALGLLLGADLERGRGPQRGWRAILASPLKPMVASSAYKVAHHGSENADLKEIWESLLAAKPYALLTPYGRGRKPLPSKEDVKRIKTNAGETYCTTWPPTIRPPRRKGVDKTMGEVTRFRRACRKRPGHIRVRVRIGGAGGESKVELFDNAKKL